ncbi:unnamed protein product [Heligmosomoides polygyrus]|uniref:Ground-like domain-containing protein n=1 Tax=Heligmosomoides polygyrus TaxID=6339 RepID=A0A183G7B0_HELPZ|nr:unnamed protein product [Heligmosomoides polygyrus]
MLFSPQPSPAGYEAVSAHIPGMHIMRHRFFAPGTVPESGDCLWTLYIVAIFFGSGGGGCGCPQPTCPPPQSCAPPPQPVCAPSCGSAAPPAPQYYPPSPPVYAAPPPPPSGYAQAGRKALLAHGVKTGSLAASGEGYLAETEGLRRVRRDTEAAFDPKCNSEALKDIILENIDSSTAVAKRQIQEAATERLGGRIDVICSTGTFSYIVNTELYCETEKSGTTCFAFRQSS